MRAVWRAPRSRPALPVHGETPALSLSREGAGWRIETPRGIVRAEKVLLATNGFTDDLWPGLRRTIVPVFSSIAATAPLSDEVARAIMPTRPVLYESGHITVYYRIDAAQPPVDGRPRPDALDQQAYRRRLSHALCGTAMAGREGRDLDARLEQPARDHAGSLSPCA